ncbi:MAG: putative lipid II flippase FtsW, partial [Clostridiaceae bacterium]
MKKSKKMGPVDFPLFLTIMLLVAIGIVMVFSSSSYTSALNPKINDSMHYLKRQGFFAIIGTFFMIITIKFDYHKIRKFTILLMIFTLVLLGLVFAFDPVNGSQRWISIGGQGFQPSELAKYVIVFYMAKGIEIKGDKIKSLFKGVIPFILISGIYAGAILIEPNLSMASIIFIVTIILLFVGGMKKTHLFIYIMPFFVVLGGAAAYLSPYRRKRLLNFLNPWADPLGDGYQLVQSLLAIGSGGLWGVGLGQSRQKCFFLPEAHTDFIFSVIAEELGLIGCIVIILLFLTLIWRGVVISIKAKDIYGTILAAGITSVIAVQAILNIAVVSGSFPVTGVP